MDEGRSDLPRHSMPALIRLLLVADITLAGLYVIDVALGHPASIVQRLVDLNEEANGAAWYSSSQLLLLGLLLAAFVLSVDRAKRSLMLYAIPLMAFALSLDEVAQLHEWVGRRSDALFASGTRSGTFFQHTGLWMLLLGPVFVIGLVVLWKALSPFVRGHARVIRLYAIGIIVYVVSVLVMETLSNLVAAGSIAAHVQIVGEELGEMVGVTLLVWATLELLAAHRIRLVVRT